MICQNNWDLPRLAKTYHDLPRFTKTYDDLHTLTKTYQDLPQHNKTYQDLPQRTKTYQNLLRLAKAFKFVFAWLFFFTFSGLVQQTFSHLKINFFVRSEVEVENPLGTNLYVEAFLRRGSLSSKSIIRSPLGCICMAIVLRNYYFLFNSNWIFGVLSQFHSFKLSTIS